MNDCGSVASLRLLTIMDLVERVEARLGNLSLYFWSLFVHWRSFREDWLDCCFKSWSKILESPSGIPPEIMDSLLTSGWLSVCEEHTGCWTPGHRNIKIHPLLSNALRWRVSETFPTSRPDFVHGTRQKLARHLAFNDCRGRHGIALMGKENPLDLGFSDIYCRPNYHPRVLECPDRCGRSHCRCAMERRCGVRTQIRLSEMLQFLYNHAIDAKGFRADKGVYS